MPTMSASSWEEYLDLNQEHFVAELVEFLRIPSISSLAEHRKDVERAGTWLQSRMETAGLEHTAVLPTDGMPVVYGDWLHAAGKPTVLIYGHFDVQPVEPLAEWQTPPFDPVVRDGRIYARGASDDKGNLLTAVLAIEALLQTDGNLPVNVKCLFEGGEEGGGGAEGLVEARRADLACDLVLNADTSQWSETEPVLLLGLRGIAGLGVFVQGPKGDLHSGTFGGTLQNPIHALAAIVASLRSAEGRVLVEGFYDQVRELSAEERAQIAQVPLDDEQYMREMDVDALFGEPGYSTLERKWVRPTLEVNGITGGFQGEGGKTIVPAWASCKISCRLVPNQDPAAVVEAVRRHIEGNAPPGVRVNAGGGGGVKAYEIPAEHWGNRAAARVLTALYGREPYATRLGGSVPICNTFLDALGAHSVGFGFALEDENIHAPNEFYRLSSFRRGQEAFALMFGELAKGK